MLMRVDLQRREGKYDFFIRDIRKEKKKEIERGPSWIGLSSLRDIFFKFKKGYRLIGFCHFFINYSLGCLLWCDN